MAENIRIQKLLANWGIASRRTIEKWINDGRISLNGKILDTQGQTVNPDNPPKIKIDGKPICKPKGSDKTSVYAFNKPENVVSTLKDDQKRKCIKDFLPKHTRLYPVGRLDMNSTGLLLITDDGELTNRLLHPSFKVEKEYVVEIAGPSLDRNEKTQFKQGLVLEDGKTAPCKLIQHKNPLVFTVILKEGRKRQIRRMFDKLNRNVVNLKRLRVGPVTLGNLRPGQMRLLNKTELKALYKAAGIKDF